MTAPVESSGRRLRWPRISRDTILFVVGLGLTINEAAVRQGPERPWLLFVFCGMMGLPIFLRRDEKGGGVSLPNLTLPTEPPSPSLPTTPNPPSLPTPPETPQQFKLPTWEEFQKWVEQQSKPKDSQ